MTPGDKHLTHLFSTTFPDNEDKPLVFNDIPASALGFSTAALCFQSHSGIVLSILNLRRSFFVLPLRHLVLAFCDCRAFYQFRQQVNPGGGASLFGVYYPQVEICGYPPLAPAGAISTQLILAAIPPAPGACTSTYHTSLSQATRQET
jgi:hypothetical protein